jgi:hypothetical protein
MAADVGFGAHPIHHVGVVQLERGAFGADAAVFRRLESVKWA